MKKQNKQTKKTKQKKLHILYYILRRLNKNILKSFALIFKKPTRAQVYV